MNFSKFLTGPALDGVDTSTLDVWAEASTERFLTPATIVTFVRTLITVVLVGLAVHEGVPDNGEFWSPALKLLVVALVVYWVGDSLDGEVARWFHHETRIGAVLDIMSDRLSAGAFYIGLAWLHPEFTVAVLIYLVEFMVIDCFLSIAFLAWKVRSPNYFYVIDKTLYAYNWSRLGKAANSGLFSIMLLTTQLPWLGVVVASLLLALKTASLVRLARVGLPIPTATGADTPA